MARGKIRPKRQKRLDAIYKRRAVDLKKYTKIKGRKGVTEEHLNVLDDAYALKRSRVIENVAYSRSNEAVLQREALPELETAFNACESRIDAAMKDLYQVSTREKLFNATKKEALSHHLREKLDQLWSLARSHRKGPELENDIRQEQARFEKYIDKHFKDQPAALRDELLKTYHDTVKTVLSVRKRVDAKLHTPYRNYFEAVHAERLSNAIVTATRDNVKKYCDEALAKINALPVPLPAFKSDKTFTATATIAAAPGGAAVPHDSATLIAAADTLKGRLAAIQASAATTEQKQAAAMDAVAAAFAPGTQLEQFMTAVDTVKASATPPPALNPDVEGFYEDLKKYKNRLDEFYGLEGLAKPHTAFAFTPPAGAVPIGVPAFVSPATLSVSFNVTPLAPAGAPAVLITTANITNGVAPPGAMETLGAALGVPPAVTAAAMKTALQAAERNADVQNLLASQDPIPDPNGVALKAAVQKHLEGVRLYIQPFAAQETIARMDAAIAAIPPASTPSAKLQAIQKAVQDAENDADLKAFLARTDLPVGSHYLELQQALKKHLEDTKAQLDKTNKAPALTYKVSPEAEKIAKAIDLEKHQADAKALAERFKKEMNKLMDGLEKGGLTPEGFDLAFGRLLKTHETEVKNLDTAVQAELAKLPAAATPAEEEARKTIEDAWKASCDALTNQAKKCSEEIKPKVEEVRKKQTEFNLKYKLLMLKEPDRFPIDRPLTEEERKDIKGTVDKMDFVKAMDERTDLNLGSGISLHLNWVPPKEANEKTGQKAEPGYFKLGSYSIEASEKDMSPESIAKLGDALELIAARAPRGPGGELSITISNVENLASLRKMMIAAATHKPPIKMYVTAKGYGDPSGRLQPTYQWLYREVEQRVDAHKKLDELDHYLLGLREVAGGNGHVDEKSGDIVLEHETIPYPKELPDALNNNVGSTAHLLAMCRPEGQEDPLIKLTTNAQQFLQRHSEMETLAATQEIVKEKKGDLAQAKTAVQTELTDAEDELAGRKVVAGAPVAAPAAGSPQEAALKHKILTLKSQIQALKLRDEIDKRLKDLAQIHPIYDKGHGDMLAQAGEILRLKIEQMHRVMNAIALLSPSDQEVYRKVLNDLADGLEKETADYIFACREAGIENPEKYLFSDEYGAEDEARIANVNLLQTHTGRAMAAGKILGHILLGILTLGIGNYLYWKGGGYRNFFDSIRNEKNPFRVSDQVPPSVKQRLSRALLEGRVVDARNVAAGQQRITREGALLKELTASFTTILPSPPVPHPSLGYPLPVAAGGHADYDAHVTAYMRVPANETEVDKLRQELWARLHPDEPMPPAPVARDDKFKELVNWQAQLQGDMLRSVSYLNKVPHVALQEAVEDGRLPEMVLLVLPEDRPKRLTSNQLLERTATLGNNWARMLVAGARDTTIEEALTALTTPRVIVGGAATLPHASLKQQREDTQAEITRLRNDIIKLEGGVLPDDADSNTLKARKRELSAATQHLKDIDAEIDRILNTDLAVQPPAIPGAPPPTPITLKDYFSRDQFLRLADMQANRRAAFDQFKNFCLEAPRTLGIVQAAQTTHLNAIKDEVISKFASAGECDAVLDGLFHTPPKYPKALNQACRGITGLPFDATTKTKEDILQPLRNELLKKALTQRGFNFGTAGTTNKAGQVLQNPASSAHDVAQSFEAIQRQVGFHFRQYGSPTVAGFNVAYAEFLRGQLQGAFLAPPAGPGFRTYHADITAALTAALDEVVAANPPAGVAPVPTVATSNAQQMIGHAIRADHPEDLQTLQRRFTAQLQIQKEPNIRATLFNAGGKWHTDVDAVDDALSDVVSKRLPKAYRDECEIQTGFEPTDDAFGATHGFKTQILSTPHTLRTQLLNHSITLHLNAVTPLSTRFARPGVLAADVSTHVDQYQKDIEKARQACVKAAKNTPALVTEINRQFAVAVRQQLETAFLAPGTTGLGGYTDGDIALALTAALDEVVAANPPAGVAPVPTVATSNAQQMIGHTIRADHPEDLQTLQRRFTAQLQIQKEPNIRATLFNAGGKWHTDVDAVDDALSDLVSGTVPKAYREECKTQTGFEPTDDRFGATNGFKTQVLDPGHALTRDLLKRSVDLHFGRVTSLAARLPVPPAVTTAPTPAQISIALNDYYKDVEKARQACIKAAKGNSTLVTEINRQFAEHIRGDLFRTLYVEQPVGSAQYFLNPRLSAEAQRALQVLPAGTGLPAGPIPDANGLLNQPITNADPTGTIHTLQTDYVNDLQVTQLAQAIMDDAITTLTARVDISEWQDAWDKIHSGNLPDVLVDACVARTGAPPTPALIAQISADYRGPVAVPGTAGTPGSFNYRVLSKLCDEALREKENLFVRNVHTASHASDLTSLLQDFYDNINEEYTRLLATTAGDLQAQQIIQNKFAAHLRDAIFRAFYDTSLGTPPYRMNSTVRRHLPQAQTPPGTIWLSDTVNDANGIGRISAADPVGDLQTLANQYVVLLQQQQRAAMLATTIDRLSPSQRRDVLDTLVRGMPSETLMDEFRDVCKEQTGVQPIPRIDQAIQRHLHTPAFKAQLLTQLLTEFDAGPGKAIEFRPLTGDAAPVVVQKFKDFCDKLEAEYKKLYELVKSDPTLLTLTQLNAHFTTLFDNQILAVQAAAHNNTPINIDGTLRSIVVPFVMSTANLSDDLNIAGNAFVKKLQQKNDFALAQAFAMGNTVAGNKSLSTADCLKVLAALARGELPDGFDSVCKKLTGEKWVDRSPLNAQLVTQLRCAVIERMLRDQLGLAAGTALTVAPAGAPVPAGHLSEALHTPRIDQDIATLTKAYLAARLATTFDMRQYRAPQSAAARKISGTNPMLGDSTITPERFVSTFEAYVRQLRQEYNALMAEIDKLPAHLQAGLKQSVRDNFATHISSEANKVMANIGQCKNYSAILDILKPAKYALLMKPPVPPTKGDPLQAIEKVATDMRVECDKYTLKHSPTGGAIIPPVGRTIL